MGRGLNRPIWVVKNLFSLRITLSETWSPVGSKLMPGLTQKWGVDMSLATISFTIPLGRILTGLRVRLKEATGPLNPTIIPSIGHFLPVEARCAVEQRFSMTTFTWELI